MGRIRVQMPWQKALGEVTPWIRVVTPHAGGDKGFHFIPEIGEEALIGFEGGNAERPYMLGGLYNGGGGAGAFQHAGNDIKALQSRSGNKLLLNDGDGSTTITDSGTAGIKMDGSGLLISQAQDRYEVNTGDGSSTLIMDKDGNIDLNGKEKLQITVGESSIVLKKDGTIEIKGKKLKLNGTDEVKIDGESIGLFGKNTIVNGTTDVNVTGASSQVFLDGSAKIIGSTVDIN